MTRFDKVKEILGALVESQPVHAHGAFWRGLTRDEFVVFQVFGEVQLVTVGDGAGSNLIKALNGQLSFGSNPNAEYRGMPAGRPPASTQQIAKAKVDENQRKGKIQTLSVVFGIIMAAIGGEVKAPGGNWATPSTWFAVLGLGVLACGGAAFWNSILEYLLKVKDIKSLQAEAERKKQS